MALIIAALAMPIGAGASNIERHGTISCATTATEIVPERLGRRGLLIVNSDASVTLYHGQHVSATDRPLTVANGTPLVAGGNFVFNDAEMTGAYHCIVSTGTVDLRFKETYK